MSAPHPNKAKMEAAVQRWIAEVQGRPNARTLLLNKADMVERFLADLSRCTRPGHTGALPKYLVGLTAFDLTAAHGDLLIAAGRHLVADAVQHIVGITPELIGSAARC